VVASRSVQSIVAMASGSPPTVADAKTKFLQKFNKPLPSLYSTVVLELLVQQHLYRWNSSYQYTPIQALGICSVFDQILQGLPEEEQAAVFSAYIQALDESPEQYRKDAKALEEFAKSADGADSLLPNAGGNDAQKMMAQISEQVAGGNFLYTKFFAVGIFRMLELVGAKDPKALGSIVEALGVPLERVNADLVTYKGILSKLKMARTIMQEFLEREKKKQAERMAQKAEKSSASETAETV
jgi:photosystem II biogenesis protein Psp29